MIFSVLSWAAVYFIVWWTTLFAVLPFGVGKPDGDEAVTPGADAGAPARARMGRVFLITTAVATLIFAAIYVVLTRNLFGLDDIPFLPKFERVS